MPKTSQKTLSSTRIAELNDAFRKTFLGGKIMLTRGISELPTDEQNAILALVRSFDDFTPDNDPYGEHDFGAIEHNGQRIFWKLDDYDATFQSLKSRGSNTSKCLHLVRMPLVCKPECFYLAVLKMMMASSL